MYYLREQLFASVIDFTLDFELYLEWLKQIELVKINKDDPALISALRKEDQALKSA